MREDVLAPGNHVGASPSLQGEVLHCVLSNDSDEERGEEEEEEVQLEVPFFLFLF